MTVGAGPRYVKARCQRAALTIGVRHGHADGAGCVPGVVAVIVVAVDDGDAGGSSAADRSPWRRPRSWCR